MSSFTKEQVAFLGLYDDDAVDDVLQIINSVHLSEKDKYDYIGNVAGELCQIQYKEWSNSLNPQNLKQDPIKVQSKPKKQHYPFLAGVDETTVNLITELLNDTTLNDKVRDNGICGLLDKKAAIYLKWKQSKGTEEFLNLLTDEVAEHVRKCMAVSDWKGVDLLTKYNPEANKLFNEWLKKNSSLTEIPKKDLKTKHLKYSIKVPSNRTKTRCDGRPLGLNTKIAFYQKRFEVAIEKTEINGETVFTAEGVPNNVLDCLIEIFGFLQKTMPISQYLPPSQADMVKNKWDKQMRISFMKKTLTDLWVTQEAGHDIVKINAWEKEQLEAAKKILNEEETALAEGRKLPSQLPKQQIPVHMVNFV